MPHSFFFLEHPCTENRACHIELSCPPLFVPQTVGRRRGQKKLKNREGSRTIKIIIASIILEVIHQFSVYRSDISSITSAGSGQAGHDHTAAVLRLLEAQN